MIAPCATRRAPRAKLDLPAPVEQRVRHVVALEHRCERARAARDEHVWFESRAVQRTGHVHCAALRTAHGERVDDDEDLDCAHAWTVSETVARIGPDAESLESTHEEVARTLKSMPSRVEGATMTAGPLNASAMPGGRLAVRTRLFGINAGAVILAVVAGILTPIHPVMAIAVLVAAVAGCIFLPRGDIAVAAFGATTFFEIVTAGPSLTPVKLVGTLVIATAALSLLVRSRADVSSESVWRGHLFPLVMGVAFLGWAMASAAWAVDLHQVRTLSSRLLTDLLVFASIPLLLRRTSHFRNVGWWIVGAALLSAAIGMAMHTSLGGRAIGLYSDPNEYATGMAICAAFALALGESSTRASARWFARFAVAGSLMGVAASASRTGVVAALLAYLVLLITARGVERVRLTGVMVTVAALALAWLIFAPGGSVAEQRFAGENSTGRGDLWRVARYQFQDEPIHGVGLGNYPVVSNRYLKRDVRNIDLFIRAPRTVHNTPLELLSELGAVGFTLFYSFIGSCVILAMRTLKRARTIEDPGMVAACRGILAALFGLIAASLTLSGMYVELLWILLGSTVAASNYVRIRIKERTQLAHEVEVGRPESWL